LRFSLSYQIGTVIRGLYTVLAGVSTWGCHEAPQRFQQDAGPECAIAYRLSNRSLGSVYVLRIATDPDRPQEQRVAMSPANAAEPISDLWLLENTGKGRVRMSNVAFPGVYLTTTVDTTTDPADALLDWHVEPVPGAYQTDVPLHLIRPADSPNQGLGTTAPHPYFVSVLQGDSDPSQHWHLSPYRYCPSSQ